VSQPHAASEIWKGIALRLELLGEPDADAALVREDQPAAWHWPRNRLRERLPAHLDHFLGLACRGAGLEFAREKRARFLARAATSHWDAIIITHSAFRFIAVPAAFERQIIEDQIAMHEALRLRSDDGDRTTRKRIEAIKERLSDRLESIKGRRDGMVTIEEIGIDQVIVDEAQEMLPAVLAELRLLSSARLDDQCQHRTDSCEQRNPSIGIGGRPERLSGTGSRHRRRGRRRERLLQVGWGYLSRRSLRVGTVDRDVAHASTQRLSSLR